MRSFVVIRVDSLSSCLVLTGNGDQNFTGLAGFLQPSIISKGFFKLSERLFKLVIIGGYAVPFV